MNAHIALLERLHRARLTVASLEGEVAAASEGFKAIHADLFRRRDAARIEADEATAALRNAGLTAFRQTGDVAPAPGIKIRMMSRPEYDEDEAFRWAKTHKMALLFDRRAFETLAKARPADFDFVTIQQEPQATIASDLGSVLDGMKE